MKCCQRKAQWSSKWKSNVMARRKKRLVFVFWCYICIPRGKWSTAIALPKKITIHHTSTINTPTQLFLLSFFSSNKIQNRLCCGERKRLPFLKVFASSGNIYNILFLPLICPYPYFSLFNFYIYEKVIILLFSPFTIFYLINHL